MQKEDYRKAFRSLRRLRNTDIQAARDLFYIHNQIQDDLEAKKGTLGSYFRRLLELFTEKRNRPATLGAFTVMSNYTTLE